MREILFRGKSVDDNEWVYGSFCRDAVEQRLGIGTGADGFIRFYDTETKKMKMVEAQRETVGQYTELNDNNKAKIFEGDIVRCYHRFLDDEFIAVVEFGNPNSAYNWGFQLRLITKTNFRTDILLWVEMEETGAFIEIIGNIHDNPELMEVIGEEK